MQLVPSGSDRAAITGSYRVIITSCWSASGPNRKPPALANLSEKAVCSRRVPGLKEPFREYSRMCPMPIWELGILSLIEHALLRMMPFRMEGKLFALPVILETKLGRALALFCCMQPAGAVRTGPLDPSPSG